MSTTSSQVLVDPQMDRRLRRDGFAVMPLWEPTQAASLRELFGELHGWEGEGFYSDLVNDDAEYRTAANDLLATFDRGVASVFEGQEVFLRSFLCKFPGTNSALHLHRDWMYVDERQGARTYVAWVALEDVTGANGQLQALRSSHLVEERVTGEKEFGDHVRGTDLIDSWLTHKDMIDDRMVTIPITAGQCIVLDNRTAHRSLPNLTDRPRVCVAFGLKPRDEPLVHFRRSNERSADRYDIDPRFFLDHTPQSLLARPPDVPVAERVLVGNLDLSPKKVRAALDRSPLARLDRITVRKNLLVDRVVGRGRLVSAEAREQTTHWASRLRSGGCKGRLGRARVRGREWWSALPTALAIRVLGLNEWIINRVSPDLPAVWDPAGFDWTERIERAWPEIRAEVDALLAGPTGIPLIEEVAGGIPQGNEGPWRTFVLMHQWKWIDWNVARCPMTTALVKDIPGLTMAGFSLLEGGSRISPHRGPNKGALRYLLGVRVPGPPGACGNRVGDETSFWADGKSVMFDFTETHEAWNDSEEYRVLLMLEVEAPLPWYLAFPNRVAQHAMSWFPTTRGIVERLESLEPTLRGDVRSPEMS